MFEKEEEKLNELRKQLEHADIPHENLDGAILQGLERAKREKQIRRTKRKRGYWTLAVSAMLLITLITSIRISPVFANVVSSIPGMEKIVALIHDDKGLTAVIENDYYQNIGVSQTKDLLTLTIDGVVLDESGMNIFYTIESPQSLEKIKINSFKLENKEGIPPSSFSYSKMNDGKLKNEYSDRIDYHFPEPYKFKDLAFTFNLNFMLNGKDTSFSLPFVIPENVKPSIKYTLNEEVEIDSQKFTIQEIKIHPLRIGVKVSFDPENTMKILQFEDMRLEDENGEVWGSIANGTSGRGVSDLEQIYFLQSNYFENPKELYLRINKIQALDKDEATVIVDTEKNLLLNSPKDGNLHLGDSSKSEVDFYLTDFEDDEHMYTLASSIKDATGIEIRMPPTSMSTYDLKKHWTIRFETTNYKNPLQLELFAYPNYIEGDIKVELKNSNQ
jgi:hypothetical protein